MNDRDVEVLGRAPLFEALDEEGARALRATVAEVQLSRGQTLFSEDQEGDRLYVILEGKIKLDSDGPRRPGEPAQRVGPSEMFGELSLFDPGPRTASAIAVTEARLAALGHSDLWPLLTGDPEMAPSAARPRPAAAAHQRDHGRPRLHRRTRPGGQGPARPGREVRPAHRDGLHVHHDLTQEELAQLVGASRETVNKALADFAHAAGCASRPAPCRSSTSNASASAPVRACTRRARRGSRAGRGRTPRRPATATRSTSAYTRSTTSRAVRSPAASAASTCCEAFPAVADVVVERARRIIERGAVARQEHRGPCLSAIARSRSSEAR